MNNIHNKLVSEKQLYDFINYYTNLYDPLLKVSINDIAKMRKILVHKSYCITNNDNIDADNYCSINFNSYLRSSNERLEFLGDSVLDFVIVEYLFDKFPYKDEDFLTKLKIKLVNKKNLCYLGRKMGIEKMILLSTMMERTGARTTNVNLIEDVFESFIGGLYKDQGIYVCKAFILGILKKHVNIQEYIDTESDFKSIVMKEFHKKFSCNPSYFLSKIQGDIKLKQFNVIIGIEKSNIPDNNKIDLITKLHKETVKNVESYEGDLSKIDLNKYILLVTNLEPKKSKKEAEQECCKIYMETINNLFNNQI